MKDKIRKARKQTARMNMEAGCLPEKRPFRLSRNTHSKAPDMKRVMIKAQQQHSNNRNATPSMPKMPWDKE